MVMLRRIEPIAVTHHDLRVIAVADRVDRALRHLNLHTQLLQRFQCDQFLRARRPGLHRLADLDEALGDDARVRRAHDRVVDLLADLARLRARRIERGLRRIACRLA